MWDFVFVLIFLVIFFSYFVLYSYSVLYNIFSCLFRSEFVMQIVQLFLSPHFLYLFLSCVDGHTLL